MSLILIMEDRAAAAEAAAAVLRAAGHEVRLCLSAAETAAAVRERRPDLVLTECLAGGDPDLLARLADLERGRRRGRLAAQNDLAGWLAHNFKNILSASLGSLRLVDLRNQNQPQAKREEYLAESRRGQEAALNLLERLLGLSAEGAAEAGPVNLAEVVDEAWAAANAEILAEMEVNAPERLTGLRERLGQVRLMNSVRRLPPLVFVRQDLAAAFTALARNALEAVLGREDPRVLFFGEIQGARLEISIRDNGRGMTREVARLARDPLFSTKGEVGVGLGLSLAAAVVERHGGEMDIQSAPGLGTTVRLSFPWRGPEAGGSGRGLKKAPPTEGYLG